MLEPRDRALLFSALRPPAGHKLDFAVGTTYSLDLLTLLTVPLSFAWFDQSEERETDRIGSVEVLGGLQKYARRLAIFCQAGFIAWPQQRYPQLAFLEEIITECGAPNGGVFHPKVWVMRYVADDGHLVYRMLCLSRNLTMARSWDTMLVLDGVRTDRGREERDSAPLADFVAALPRMAIRGLTHDRTQEIQNLVAELRQVKFECPEGFESFRMWPLGIEGHHSWPFGDAGKRFLIVSPFLAVNSLEKLAGSGLESVLVSTAYGLKELARRPRGYSRFYTLNDRAVPEATDSEITLASEDPAELVQLSGLHAKLYVSDSGSTTAIWTGSANTTEAAFESNVEFLVQLNGQRSRVGIDKLLGVEKDSSGLRDMLIEADTLVSSAIPNDDEVHCERLLDRARLWIATRPLSLHVSSHDDRFDVALKGCENDSATPNGVEVRCWLNTTSPDQSISLPTSEGVVRFTGVTFEALTPFLAVEVVASIGAARRRARFVLNLPLHGAPSDRRDRILQSLIKDKSRFTRYVWMLLTDPSEWIAGTTQSSESGEQQGDRKPAHELSPLFELLVRTLHRNPERLDDIAGLLKSVGTATKDAEAVIPPDFAEIWAPIWAVRERMKAEDSRD